jgi:hypothetical protein
MTSRCPAFNVYLPKLLDLIMDRSTLKSIAAQINLSVYDTIKLLKQHIPYHQLSNNQNHIKIFKNTDLIYQDNNTSAKQIVANTRLLNLNGMNDHDVNPEHGSRYIAMDLNTVATKKITTQSEMIFHQQFGEVRAIGHSTPVLNEHGDCIGVLVFGSVDLSLSVMDFARTFSYLSRGLAKYFIHHESYHFIQGTRLVTLYFREIECILYLLIGLSSKEISRFMSISPRSVESCITRLKNKLGAESTHSLVKLIVNDEFFGRL